MIRGGFREDETHTEQIPEQTLKVAMELEAHEKECAMFRELVNDKLDSLDKRLWRLRGNDYGQHCLGRRYGRPAVFMGIR